MFLPTTWRSPAAVIALALAAAVACSDRRPESIMGPGAITGPSLNESGEDRPTPPAWDGEHNSHYTTSSVIAALAHTDFTSAVVSVAEIGGHYQAAVLSSAQQGFPREGSSYLSISSGDARTPGNGMWNGLQCVGDATYGSLCNVGGLDVTVKVPQGATNLTFEYRYWSVDYCSYLDPFRVSLVAPGGSTTQIAVSDRQSEFNCFYNGTLLWSETLRTVTANVSAHAGQNLVLRFRASDRFDTALPAGALVDNLRFDAPVVKPAPTATFNTPAQVNEGTDAAISLSSPSAADLRYAFDCGKGYGSLGSASSTTCPAADDGHLTVKGKVVDATDDNLFTEYTAEIDVENVAPTATFGNDGPVDEGSAFNLKLTDPQDVAADVAAGFTYAFDCGSGYGATGASSTASCVTSDNGVRSVKGKIIDKDGGETEYDATVTVANVAPTASMNAPGSVAEGTAIQVSLEDASDVSSADVAAGFTYAFDCGTGYGAFGASSSASCATTDNGTRSVKAKVRDKDDGVTEYSASVDVTNVAPAVTSITLPSEPIAVNTPITIRASFTDVGTADTHTGSFDLDFNGAKAAGTVAETDGSGSVTATVTYDTPGVYTITATVTDDDLGSHSRSSAVDVPAYIVVYDPNAGFVTGGGWINSPKGAYAADPNLTGKANFGFVSKYLPGANKPTGKTEFQFKAGNLNFHSASYDWLVVAGAQAKYKGEGTINGGGSYGFMLTAIDGALKGGAGGPDEFRIKIWKLATGEVVYDNKMGEGDDSNAATAIGGGSIVIHK